LRWLWEVKLERDTGIATTEGLARLSLPRFALHVLGVLVSSFLHRENLIKAMLTGDEPGRNVDVRIC
jgi:cytochrome b